MPTANAGHGSSTIAACTVRSLIWSRPLALPSSPVPSNADHEYDYVLEMNEPALAAWAEVNGFSLVELTMIQPSLTSGRPTTKPSLRSIVSR